MECFLLRANALCKGFSGIRPEVVGNARPDVEQTGSSCCSRKGFFRRKRRPGSTVPHVFSSTGQGVRHITTAKDERC